MLDQTKGDFFDSYQKRALESAQYPEVGRNIVYPTLGLNGEAGELLEVLSERGSGCLDHGRVKKEAGDLGWYIAVTAFEFGLKLSDIVERALNRSGLEGYSGYVQISIAVGRVAERVKKIERDGDGIVDEDNREKVADALSVAFWGLCEVCEGLGVSVEEVMQENLDKLGDRMQRGVIKGEGDER